MRHLVAALGVVCALAAPARSQCVLFNGSINVTSAPARGCHWFFFPDMANRDVLNVSVLVVDPGGFPCADQEVTVKFVAVAGTVGICADEAEITGTTSMIGLITFSFSRLYGHGTFLIEAWSGATFLDGTPPQTTTSPDLTGDATVDFFDLGDWAQSLPPAPVMCPPPVFQRHDYNCDGCIDIFDLALFAGGIGHGC
jgi:hypothetical protein